MKYKIAFINLLFSLSIIMLFLSLSHTLWHPYSFSELNGFYKTTYIILLVNLCLGPLLILIIHKENKRHLKKDLYILAFIQFAAFIFGGYSIYMRHPVYAVFTVDRFTLINAGNATPNKVRYDELKTSFFSMPKLVFAKSPTKPEERNALLMGVLFEGKPDLDELAEYYEPFPNHIDEILARRIDTSLILSNEKSKTKLNLFIKKYGGNVEDYVYFPLQTANRRDVILAFIKNTLQPVDIIKIDPWEIRKTKEKIKPATDIEVKPWEMMAMYQDPPDCLLLSSYSYCSKGFSNT